MNEIFPKETNRQQMLKKLLNQANVKSSLRHEDIYTLKPLITPFIQ